MAKLLLQRGEVVKQIARGAADASFENDTALPAGGNGDGLAAGSAEEGADGWAHGEAAV